MGNRIRPSDDVVQNNIKKWNIPQPDREYTVVIHCTTYNHGKYIKDALEGFVNQKCTYSFCAIIIDDCSTDNAPEIIRDYADKYPDIIKPILLGENHMQHGILRDPYFEKWHQCTKYIAQCEGDDYWIDPIKLQMQVDFMECHPDYGLIHTNFDSIPIKRLTAKVPINEQDEYLGDMLSGDYPIGTLTSLYRVSILNKLPNYRKNIDFKMGDQPLWIEFASVSKIKYIDKITAIYRITENSASHNKDINKELEFLKSSCCCRSYYAKKFNVNIKSPMPMYYAMAMKSAFNHKLPEMADILLKEAKTNRALSMKLFVFFIGTKYSAIRRVIDNHYKK